MGRCSTMLLDMPITISFCSLTSVPLEILSAQRSTLSRLAVAIAGTVICIKASRRRSLLLMLSDNVILFE